MAYSELIKNFSKIRDYMRDFYVYGFRTRTEFDKKSARSYDNERRRMESWLGDYMSFRQNESGKNVFISVDSRDIVSNPLFNAFKAKSFTDNDITLYFYVMDLLKDGEGYTAAEINELITDRYIHALGNDNEFDLSTLRKKLKEFEQLGLVVSEKDGNRQLFRRNDNKYFNYLTSTAFADAVEFFAEDSPVGVIGSYIADRNEMITGKEKTSVFAYKHHYILDAIDSEIMYELINAIGQRKVVEISSVSKKGRDIKRTICPMKMLISTQQGRYYVAGYNYRDADFHLMRIDNIRSITVLHEEPMYEEYAEMYSRFRKNLWGCSTSRYRYTDHIEMDIHVGRKEFYIINRLEREKRCGTVMQIDEQTWRYSADVYDAVEMLPWIRTFTGRIVRLYCTNETVQESFYNDLGAMFRMYGGETNAVQ